MEHSRLVAAARTWKRKGRVCRGQRCCPYIDFRPPDLGQDVLVICYVCHGSLKKCTVSSWGNDSAMENHAASPLTVDRSSVPSTHIQQFKIAFRSRATNTFFVLQTGTDRLPPQHTKIFLGKYLSNKLHACTDCDAGCWDVAEGH